MGDIVILTMYYVVFGFVVNLAVQGMRNSSTPWQEDTIGIMVIWPLYVLKWILLGILFLLFEGGDSLSLAFKRLFR